MPNINIVILKDLAEKMPDVSIQEKHIRIAVKTSENYRAEKWERGKFRGIIHRDR